MKATGFVSLINYMVKVTEIRRTCFACPSKLDIHVSRFGFTLPLRWGTLSVRAGSTIKDVVAGPTIFEWHNDDDYDGFMEYDELRRITAEVLDLPDVEFGEESDGIPAKR